MTFSLTLGGKPLISATSFFRYYDTADRDKPNKQVPNVPRTSLYKVQKYLELFLELSLELSLELLYATQVQFKAELINWEDRN